MNLFIDTNIYLSFYHFTDDDLEELKKLLLVIEDGNIKLFVTNQVVNEYKRNRETKIADAIQRMKDQQIYKQFPQICKGYKEYKELRKAIISYERNRNELISKLLADIQNKRLGADKIISELFEKATQIDETNAIVKIASHRCDLGNPPGKKGSYGDAINWELLLQSISNDEDLNFITNDADYVSQIDNDLFSEFLLDEWKQKKNSKIIFFKNLSSFFEKYFPNIKVASDILRKISITNLVKSSNFARTHIVIAKLSQISDFSESELSDIIEAILTNEQIRLITKDPDIKQFIINLIKDYSEKITSEKKDELRKLILGEVLESENNLADVPF